MAAPRYLVGILMITVTLLINAEIFLRFFINLPLDGVSEIVLALFPWLSLLGAAVAIGVPGAHVALHLLEGRIPQRAKVLISVLINVATIAFGLFLIVQGTNYAAMTSGEISNVLEIPRPWEIYPFIVAGALFGVSSLIAIVKLVPLSSKK